MTKTKQTGEKEYVVPKFYADKIILEAYAVTTKSSAMLKLCEIDVTGNIGEKFYNSQKLSKGGSTLFTILNNLHSLNPDCEIKVSVKIL